MDCELAKRKLRARSDLSLSLIDFLIRVNFLPSEGFTLLNDLRIFAPMELNISLLFYTANLLFIVTNIYGWLLKWFYKAKAYGKNHDLLFPAQKTDGTLYLVQLFELPYLLMVGNATALFYVNAFSTMLFPALMMVMCQVYFFLKMPSMRHLFLYFLPVGCITLYLLTVAVGWVSLSTIGKQMMFGVVTLAVTGYLAMIVRIQLKIRKQIRQINERSYSSESDFPVRFAQRVQWLTIGISVLMYANFVADDVWVKMGRDILFTITNVWFLFYTLNPHRRGILKEEGMETVNNGRYRMSEERCNELQALVFGIITTEKLYLDSHLSIDILSKKAGTNKSYVSEAFVRSSYESFYNAINTFRVEYAAKLLLKQPELAIEAIGKTSGFSSVSLFSRLFKQHKGISPSQFRTSLPTSPQSLQPWN